MFSFVMFTVFVGGFVVSASCPSWQPPDRGSSVMVFELPASQ